MFRLRKSTYEDIDTLVQIADDARALLKSKGISQWQRGTYPSRDTFLGDVKEGIGYVVEELSDTTGLSLGVVAVCAVTFTDELCYRHLESGHWSTSDDLLYATIHRSAVARAHQGRHISTFLFDEIAKLAKEEGALSIRIDTHPDNLTMQKALVRAGFTRLIQVDARGDLARDFGCARPVDESAIYRRSTDRNGMKTSSADIFITKSLRILAERLSQSEIEDSH